MNQSIFVGFLSTFLPMFAIANPIGAVPVFLSLLKSPEKPTEPPEPRRMPDESEEHYQLKRSELKAYEIKYQQYLEECKKYKQHSREQAKQTAIFVFIVLAVFLFGGKAILEHFDISLGVLRIAGGIIVAKIGWTLAVANTTLTKEEKEAAQAKDNISFTPMAIPMISGPGAISLVISLTEEVNEWTAYLSSFMAIAFLSLLVWLCLRSSEYLNQVIGDDGMGALKRVFGFFVLAIAVQLIVNGILGVLEAYQQVLFAVAN
ncbi:membrane protein, MarC family [Rivularia sp. PCC 7116]|nr:membrane protein, MarC family [Rivularia sp. PCC 7116]